MFNFGVPDYFGVPDLQGMDYTTNSKMLLFIFNKEFVVTTELYYNMKKRQYSFDMMKAFLVRHSSEYETSASNRKVNRNT